jgi:hypothetical protein
VAIAGAITASTDSREWIEVPGVARNYTAHLCSIQGKSLVGEKKEKSGMRRVVRAVAVAK